MKCVIQNPNKDYEEHDALKKSRTVRSVTDNSKAAGGNEAVDDK